MSSVVIGVDLGGTNLRTALLSVEGDILDRRKEATNASDGWKKVVARLVDNIKQQREIAIQRGLHVMAVGVGAPGVIRMDKGVVVKSPNFPDWNNQSVRATASRLPSGGPPKQSLPGFMTPADRRSCLTRAARLASPASRS